MHCLQHFPHLRRLGFLSQHSQDLVVAYLTHLQVRQYAPTTIQTKPRHDFLGLCHSR